MVNKSLLVVKFALPLYLFLLLGHHSIAEGRLAAPNRILFNDSSGIVISAHQFDSLVSSLLIKFKSDRSKKTIEEYILLVKVCNTIGFDRLDDSSKEYSELFTLYNVKYVEKIVKITEATLSGGLSFYSKKYDLQIGGRKTKDNYFRIIH